MCSNRSSLPYFESLKCSTLVWYSYMIYRIQSKLHLTHLYIVYVIDVAD